jgi:hypothetical protein
MNPSATFLFHGSCNDLLPRSRRNRDIKLPLTGRPAVKDALESLGVPHTEVDIILINGIPVDFRAKAANGDSIEVYPPEKSPERQLPLHLHRIPEYPRFICDVHCGRLARYLRMLGFDTLYRNDYTDARIASTASEDNRIVLTRDVGLLKRAEIVCGYWLRSTNSIAQVDEVIRRYRLQDKVRPFVRCMRCNGMLVPVDKQSIISELKPQTRRYYDRFTRCSSCKAIYWEGSHVEQMRRIADWGLRNAD